MTQCFLRQKRIPLKKRKFHYVYLEHASSLYCVASNLNLKPNSEFLLQLFSVYLGFDVIGVTITIILLPTLPLSDWIKKKSVLKSIYENSIMFI
jgi:hypothetical protein